MPRDRVITMGAAGRHFHNFNACSRNNDAYEVVAFTATQNPHIESRVYPPELAGDSYPEAMPIYPETGLTRLIRHLKADQVVFSYAVGSIFDSLAKHPTAGPVLPTVGYSQEQTKELVETINATPCDLVILAAPIDLHQTVRINKLCERVPYELQEIGEPTLADVLTERFG